LCRTGRRLERYLAAIAAKCLAELCGKKAQKPRPCCLSASRHVIVAESVLIEQVVHCDGVAARVATFRSIAAQRLP
jgi:hypothetical protein